LKLESQQKTKPSILPSTVGSKTLFNLQDFVFNILQLSHQSSIWASVQTCLSS